MRIALVQCPAFGIDRPPLALGSLSAVLKKQGYETRCYDFNIDFFAHMSAEDKRLWDFSNCHRWADEKEFSHIREISDNCCARWLNELRSFNPDIVGFSVHVTSQLYSTILAKLIKSAAPGTVVIFGGPIMLTHSLGHTENILRVKNERGVNVVDVAVAGEGELTLVELVERIINKKTYDGCKGSVFMGEQGAIDNGPRDYIDDLDSLPYPDYSDFVLGSYVNNRENRLPILGSRGCTHKCVFCDDTLICGKYRCRSAQNVFDEMKLRKSQGINILDFNDLLINGNYAQLTELCDLLIGSKLRISWGASASVDPRLDLPMLKKLKAAGCHYLNYGIESASPKVLKDMNKAFSIQDVHRVVHFTYAANIAVCTNWIVGFPTETQEDFELTLAFVKEHYKYIKNGLMVNSFIVKGRCFLRDHLDRFKVVLDPDGVWSVPHVNTVAIRQQRYLAFIDLISKLNGAVAKSTFHG